MAEKFNINITPGVIALYGNPIWVEVHVYDDETNIPISGRIVNFKVSSDDTVNNLYSGTLITDKSGKAATQIADIITTVLPPPEAVAADDFLQEIDISFKYIVDCWISDIESKECHIRCIYGRLNESAVRYLGNRNLNIFTFKFLNKNANFIATTRTSNRNFKLFESEIVPLYFIGTGDDVTITGKTESKSFKTTYLTGYQINLAEIRKEYGDSIMIYYDYDKYILIEILPDPDVIESILFEYRNTFGFRERFITTGKSYSQLSNTTESEAVKYEKTTDSVVPLKAYPEYERIRTVTTGYLNNNRVNALRSLLSAEEVWIIRDQDRERVTVSISDKIPDKILEPLNLNLTVKSISTEQGFIPELDSFDYSDPRIHNIMFNDKFN